MSGNNRYLAVHGHFYQPPRENPWTGRIEPQPSAFPWPDWNSRIAAECYLPMAGSAIRDKDGAAAGMCNNYARISFNFGPTLLSWLDGAAPEAAGRLRDAVAAHRSSALAQSYSHLMLPLADARDRHTQIVWGLREFRRRFGFRPEGMWLPECGIDRETLRALVDHGVKFVILSPHQASRARPFGETEWRDVSMGGIDTRRAYRAFETDGAGRTHFNRSLDIVFYTPGLNLKISFDRLLNRPDDLARELEACFDPARSGAQLASIVTDGEIYGHHEKNGEEALTRLFMKTAPDLGLKTCSVGDFIRENPPSWEVKLWEGEDGNGSSWSCRHGMGRWFRDCGCGADQGRNWNQSWRRPLRDAFDDLRGKVRETCRRALGALLWDFADARDDYIDVVLDPGPERRSAFLARHAQRRLTPEEQGAVWRLLEADRNAMLMYTSCGWFFDELSGLEPVQNMRYALRAAELVRPFRDDDPADALAGKLALATSNLPRFGDGGEVFRRLALPSMHSDRELAAALAMCQAAGLPSGCLAWRLAASGPTERCEYGGMSLAWGDFRCRDDVLDRDIAVVWLADLSDLDAAAVLLHDLAVVQADRFAGPAMEESPPPPGDEWIRGLFSLPPDRLREAIASGGVAATRLPADVREMLYRRFSAEAESGLRARAAALGREEVALLLRARTYSAGTAGALPVRAACALEAGIEAAVHEAIAARNFGDASADEVAGTRKTAEALDLGVSLDRPSRALAWTIREILHWLANAAAPGWLDSLKALPAGNEGEWIAPAAPANRRFAYPQAGAAAAALGTCMASWRRELLAAPDPGAAALASQFIPEILAFARRAGLAIPKDTGAAREFWAFLDAPLARLIVRDPAGTLAGEAGDRLRRAGCDLGFADEAMRQRLMDAARRAMTGENRS